MKWLALLIGVAAIHPFARWFERNQRNANQAWFLVGFLPFVIFGLGLTDGFRLFMAPVSWAFWPGYVKGIEISALDLVAVALLFKLPRTPFALPLKIPAAIYALAIVISAFNVPIWEPPIFYLWQFARASLLYVVVVRGCYANKYVPLQILHGMAIGICYEVMVVLVQRFAFGMLQPTGTFGHQNFLGLITHFVTFPCLLLYLAGYRGRFPILATLSGACIAALTASRATIGLAGAGFGLSFVISSMRSWTSHKTVVLMVGVVVATVISAVALGSLDRRYAVNPLDETYDERAAFEFAAEMMVQDHPFGVGANSFVLAANTLGYYDKAKVAPIGASRSANVHNVYWLVIAETGYLGLFGFVLLLLRPLWLAFRYGWTARKDTRGDILLGFGASFIVVYIHCLFEWVLVMMATQYFFAIAAGITAGLSLGLRLENKLSERPPDN